MHKWNKNGEDMEDKVVQAFSKDGKKSDSGFYEFFNQDLLLKFVDSKATSNQLIIGVELSCTNK